MTLLASATRPRVAQLVRMFASPHDGEALGAVRAIGRVLDASGASFADLAEVIERDPAPRIEYRGSQQRRAENRAGPPTWGALDRTARMAWLAEARESEALSAWERAFAASLHGQVQAFRLPSAKQAAVADGILAKLYAVGVRAWP